MAASLLPGGGGVIGRAGGTSGRRAAGTPGPGLAAALALVVVAAAAGCAGPPAPLGPPEVLTDSLLARDDSRELRLVRLRDDRGTVHEGWLHMVPPPTGGGASPRGATVRSADGTGAYEPVLVLGGIGTGRHAAEIVPCPPGFAVFALDYPYDGPREPTRAEALRNLGKIRRAAYAAPRGVAAAVRYLSARPDMGDRGAIVVGASFGTPFLLRGVADLPRERDAAGADRGPRGVRAVSILFGGADLPTLARYRMRDRPWWERELVAWGLALFFDGLDPRHTARLVSPRPLLLVNGAGDEFVSEASARALERAARAPKRQIWLPGQHLQPDADELLRELTLRTLQWLGEVEGAPGTPPRNPGTRRMP